MALSKEWCCSLRTDVGVHRSSVHGLDELPKALLVAVHLPVSTDEEFPAHDCSFCGCSLGVCSGLQGSTKGALLVGLASERISRCTEYLWTWYMKTTPLLALHWMASTRPWTRRSIWERGRGREKCHAAFKYGAKTSHFQVKTDRLNSDPDVFFVPDINRDMQLHLSIPHFCGLKSSDDIAEDFCECNSCVYDNFAEFPLETKKW